MRVGSSSRLIKKIKKTAASPFCLTWSTVAGEPQIVPTYVNDPEASGGMAA